MTRLLIRSGKDPFTPVVAESTLTQDVFNSNSGNYLFQHSVWKALSVDGAELVSNGDAVRARAARAGRRRRGSTTSSTTSSCRWPTRSGPSSRPASTGSASCSKSVTIPVTVTGIGAQAPHGQGIESLAPIADTVKTFVGLVLDRSASIGVRGEFTRSYLLSLGFPDDSIDVIGCPSLFLHGRDFTVDKKVDAITTDSPLALNLTPEVPGIGAFATAQAERHPNLTYIGQDAHDLRLLLWGVAVPARPRPARAGAPRPPALPAGPHAAVPRHLALVRLPGDAATSPTAPGSTAMSPRCSAARRRCCWPTTRAPSSSPTTTACRSRRCRRSTPTLKVEDLYEATDMSEFNADAAGGLRPLHRLPRAQRARAHLEPRATAPATSTTASPPRRSRPPCTR